MTDTTVLTRREAHEEVKPKKLTRKVIILDLLKEKGAMTADDIVYCLSENGTIRYMDRNFAAPRLTELKSAGKVKVVGKSKSWLTGKNVAVWEAV